MPKQYLIYYAQYFGGHYRPPEVKQQLAFGFEDIEAFLGTHVIDMKFGDPEGDKARARHLEFVKDQMKTTVNWVCPGMSRRGFASPDPLEKSPKYSLQVLEVPDDLFVTGKGALQKLVDDILVNAARITQMDWGFVNVLSSALNRKA